MLEKQKVPALKRIMHILDLLEARGACPAAEIIEALALPKSTVYVLLEELQKEGLVRRNDAGHWQLWLRLIALGNAASANLDIRDVARKSLFSLMEETGLLCHLGIMDGKAAYYILKVESRGTISVRTHEGKRLSLNRSGLGKCLLAWQTQEVREQIVRSLEYPAVTATTITSAEALLAELTCIRDRGWAFDDGEDVEDVRCVAAPVFGADKTLVAAVSVVGARQQIAKENAPALAERVMAHTRDISHVLGWSGATVE